MAKEAFAQASKKAGVSSGVGARKGTASLGASLLQRWNDERQLLERVVDGAGLHAMQRYKALLAERRAFNEDPVRDMVVDMMIEDPQEFANLPFIYFSLASSNEEDFRHKISLLANCDHPRLDEAIDSLFAIAKRDDDELAIVLMCQISYDNEHAWNLLNAMEADRLLARFRQKPYLVGLFVDVWFHWQACSRPAGSVAAALARLDELDMPDDEEILSAWAAAGSERAEELLIQLGQKAGPDDVDVDEGALLSLFDLLKVPDPE